MKTKIPSATAIFFGRGPPGRGGDERKEKQGERARVPVVARISFILLNGHTFPRRCDSAQASPLPGSPFARRRDRAANAEGPDLRRSALCSEARRGVRSRTEPVDAVARVGHTGWQGGSMTKATWVRAVFVRWPRWPPWPRRTRSCCATGRESRARSSACGATGSSSRSRGRGSRAPAPTTARTCAASRSTTVQLVLVLRLPGSAPSGMRERTVTVDARTGWTDTGIDVRRGQEVRFRASGKVRWGPDRSDGPGGEGGNHYNANRPIPNRPARRAHRQGGQPPGLLLRGRRARADLVRRLGSALPGDQRRLPPGQLGKLPGHRVLLVAQARSGPGASHRSCSWSSSIE